LPVAAPPPVTVWAGMKNILEIFVVNVNLIHWDK
jgi:hypothetical protein